MDIPEGFVHVCQGSVSGQRPFKHVEGISVGSAKNDASSHPLHISQGEAPRHGKICDPATPRMSSKPEICSIASAPRGTGDSVEWSLFHMWYTVPQGKSWEVTVEPRNEGPKQVSLIVAPKARQDEGDWHAVELLSREVVYR